MQREPASAKKNTIMAQSLDETRRARLKITGRVQGVYFRASACQEAQKLGLTGWVMNCHDGSVELVAEGSSEQIDQFIVWCRRGPSGARVLEVNIRWEQAEKGFYSFSIRH